MRSIPGTVTAYHSSDTARRHRGFISGGDTVTLLIPTVDRTKFAAVELVVDDLLHTHSDIWAVGPVPSHPDNTTVYAVESQFTVAVNDFEDALEDVARRHGLHHITYAHAQASQVLAYADPDGVDA